MSERLPYEFDLVHDVKTMDDVKAIANYEGHCSDASPEDLVEMFQTLNMELPECLKSFDSMEIWVCKDGSWLPYEPLFEEKHKYRKTRIKKFEE